MQVKITKAWYLLYLSGSATNARPFHVFTNKSVEFTMSPTISTVDLARCTKGQALQSSSDFSPLYRETPGCFTGGNNVQVKIFYTSKTYVASPLLTYFQNVYFILRFCPGEVL